MDNIQLGSIKHKETLRPSVLPDNRKIFFYPIGIGLIVCIAGIVLDNLIMIILPLIILAVFPGLPVFFHLLYYLFVKVEILPDKIIITDYVSNKFVRYKKHQELHFSEISYISYLGREINLLLSLRSKLKKFDIPAKETDYTKTNLINKYNVPSALIEKFESSKQNTLTDYTATGILMKLDEIHAKYNVSKETRRHIKESLKDNSNFNLDFVKSSLRNYPISSEDIEDLTDEFSNINTDIPSAFLLTQVNLVKYKQAEKGRNGAHITVKTDISLVLSNRNGTKKIYFMHFHDLSKKDSRRFVKLIYDKQPEVKFLMTNKERINLFGE